jgi:V/A-type H+-transporting ATPase subunit E
MKKGMEKISEAVLDKVKVEAKNIIKEAENKVRKGIKKAKQQQAARLLKEKDRMIEEAEGEATRILAKASIKTRQELLAAKTEVIDEISSGVKKALSGFSGDESSPLNLIKEAVGVLGINKARVYVSPGSVNTVKKLLKRDKELAGKITEIKEVDCTGGAIVEDVDGKVRIDNTYETRLEMLLPRLLPEINKELFKGL